MKEHYKKKIKLAIKNKNIIQVLNHALIKRWPIWYIKDKNILDLHMQNIAYRKLEKRYNRSINECFENNKKLNLGEYTKTIWWCWLQGFEQAPELVKSCYYSLKRNMKDYNIVILTYKNIYEYITIPEYIMKKYEKKIISDAHFSDIVRLEVLLKYGGIWIDSTVFCTDNKMCKILESSDLFVYQDLVNPNIVASNWLISAKPNNKIIAMTERLLVEFWKNNAVVYHYFIMHLFFKMATKKYSEEWKNVKTFDNISPHILVKELNDEYDEERFNEIKRISSFHKLNHKLNYKDDGKSFYSNLIKKGNSIYE